MVETRLDSIQPLATPDQKDALINKVAQELGSGQTLLKPVDAAPDSTLARYGIVTAKGLMHVPDGIVTSVIHHVENPLDTLGAVGMGAGMAVVMKAVLPKNLAGKVAGAAIGGYFAYKAAEPIMDAYHKAGLATSMGELDNASKQFGMAGGDFVVGTALAAGGYKLGAKVTDRVLTSQSMAGFVEAKSNFYDQVGDSAAKMGSIIGITKPRGVGLMPEGYGAVPPYLLEQLAQKNPLNQDFARTHQLTVDMQSRVSGFRPRVIEEAAAPAQREVYDAKGKQSLPGEKARFENDKATGNAEVDNAFDFTGFIRDFYQKEYGRNSIDGKGMKLVSTVNYGRNYENAFWNGSQMTYGKPGASSPFKTFVLLDVAGHEITHGVTEMESNLRYRGQSGALNESLSDVFGSLIKQYAKGQEASQADWLVGEGIWKENVKGRALRDMKNPGTAYDDPSIGKDPQPAHMDQYYKTSGDNGGVHYNSGIPNRAFVNFAEAVGGKAWERPGHIWFQARRAAGSEPSFQQFAYHTIEQAKAMGHSDLVPKLEKAWDSVGVKPDATAKDTQTPGGGGGPWDDSAGGHSHLSRLLKRLAG